MKKWMILLSLALVTGCSQLDRLDSVSASERGNSEVTTEQAQDNAKTILKHTASPRAVQQLEGIESSVKQRTVLPGE